MKYYYLHPFKPQYFFPKDFKKNKIMRSFYKPYSFVGFISWWLFKNSIIYRTLFEKNNIETHIPEKNIRRIVGTKAQMAFNTGTTGIEQKITALGVINKEEFFIKYAQTEISRFNVTNEHNVLQQLSSLNYVPKVLDYYQDDQQVLLKTTVLEGNRLGFILMNDNILDCLINLEMMQIKTHKEPSTSLEKSFAHGDFCPWNMMINKNKILLYDWEMAGNYSLGYDLFTFIFQSNFLLNPKKSLDIIFLENEKFVIKYFSHFNISEWKEYLVNFAKEKIELEKNKSVNNLLFKYQNLLKYA